MRRALVIGLAVLAGLTIAHAARSASPPLPPPTAPVARPNPALFGLRVDYEAPLPTPAGGVAELPPLEPAATDASYADQNYLHYHLIGDLGGFERPLIGGDSLSSGGRIVVGVTSRPQLPLFQNAAGGGIKSYTFTGGALPPPDNGHRPVPGLGVPPTTPPPTPGNTPPPPNQGFGGQPGPPGTTTGSTTTGTTTSPRPTTTTTTTTTTPTTTTATGTTATAATTTTASPPTTTAGATTTAPTTTAPPPGCTPVSGVLITSSPAGCQIYAVNMAPGNATSELVTVKNTSGRSYTLAFKVTGAHNQLWNDLRLGVYEQSTPAPNPLPPLLDWATQFNDLTTLADGQSITFVITLYLPTSAGNADQDLGATIDFHWRATG